MNGELLCGYAQGSQARRAERSRGRSAERGRCSDAMPTAPKSSVRAITELYKGKASILDRRPHILMSSPEPRTRRGQLKISFLLIKTRTLLHYRRNENPRRHRQDLLLAEVTDFWLILQANRPMVCTQSDGTSASTLTEPFAALLQTRRGDKIGTWNSTLVIIETLQSLMMCTLKYNQITLSEIRPEKRRTWHCGAETAWCVYEKAEFGVLDEDTTHPRDIHHRWTIQSTLVVLNLSLVPERGTEGDPP